MNESNTLPNGTPIIRTYDDPSLVFEMEDSDGPSSGIPKISYEFDQCQRDLRELISLANQWPDALEAIYRFIDHGLVFMSPEIDFEAAKAAGHGVAVYKLADDLLRLLATLRARYPDPDEIKLLIAHTFPSD